MDTLYGLPLDRWFDLINLIALFGWCPLIFLPRWRWTPLVAGAAIPALLALAYVLLIGAALTSGSGEDSGAGFMSLEGIAALFSNRTALLVGWAHYLALDLFTGAWEGRDGKAVGVPHLLLVPCLLLTFMAGPAGLLLYLIVRAIRTRTILPFA